MMVCQDLSLPQMGGSQSASRFKLIGSQTQRQKSLTYANIPLSGEHWETGILFYSYYAEPWGDSQLRTISLLAPFHPMNTSPTGHQSQSIKGCIFWQQPLSLGHQICAQAPFLEMPKTSGKTEEGHEVGTCWPPQSLKRIIVSLQMFV